MVLKTGLIIRKSPFIRERRRGLWAAFLMAAGYVIEVSSLFARHDHEAGGGRVKGGGIIFYAEQRRKKSLRKGRHDRPLTLLEPDRSLPWQKNKGGKLNYRRRSEKAGPRRRRRSDPIPCPIVPLVPELAAVFGKNRDSLGGT